MILPNLLSCGRFKKAVSLLIAVSFIFSSLAFADTPNVSASDIKKEIQITTDPEKIVIPRDYGLVKAKYASKDPGKLVIHIQDAHCNYEAQSNIIKILECLIKNDGLGLISVEGADGFIDTSWFKAFPDADIRKEVADYFMKKGEITGPEFLSITSDYPIKLFGAETRSYYIENLNAFTSSYPLKEDTEKYFNQIKAVLNKLKNTIYSEALKDLDAKSQDYESKKLSFTDYVKYLEGLAGEHKIALRQYGNLFKLVSVLIYEKKINFNVVDKERAAVIDAITKKLDKDQLAELVNKSLEFKSGKISSAEYYSYLKALASKYGISLVDDYPNLFNYIIYNSVYSRIENEKLFNDIKKFEEAIKEKLFENDDQRTLDKLSRHINILTGLVNIKLLNGDFDYYKAHKEEFAYEIFADFIKRMADKFGFAYEIDPPSQAVSESMPKLEDFYAIAIKRDKALVDNTMDAMKKENARVSVLVTGGFHSEGITKLLEKQGVSYIVICPNITKDVETPYIKILTNQRTPLEEILSDTGAAATTDANNVKSGMLAPYPITGIIDQKLNDMLSLLLEKRESEFMEGWVKNYVNLWFPAAKEFVEKDGLKFNLQTAVTLLNSHLNKAPKQYKRTWQNKAIDISKESVPDKAVEFNYLEQNFNIAKVLAEKYIKSLFTDIKLFLGGIHISLGDINDDAVTVRELTENAAVIVNSKGKELGVSIVKTSIAGSSVTLCKIGSRTYEVIGKSIHLGEILRHKDENDILGWVGNEDLLSFFNLSPEDVFYLPARVTPSGLKPYFYDLLQEPISRIANPDIYPANPALQDLETARTYLAQNTYNANASFVELIKRLHWLAVLSRSNISVVKDYHAVIEDIAAATKGLMDMELNDNIKVRSIAAEIFKSISVVIVKAKTESLSIGGVTSVTLSDEESRKIKEAEPFIIEDPERDLERLREVAAGVIASGKINPYVIINIKNFSGTTHIAYARFLEDISRKYNGNITFILSIENPRALKGDLSGAYTARRRAIDILGDDFWMKERVLTAPDGGEKTRAANAGTAYEAWSRSLTTDAIPFLEDNIVTGSAMWLLLPKFGMGKNGQNYKLWLASDGLIRFGKINLAGKPLSEIPEDLQLAACGLDAPVLTENQMNYIKIKVLEAADFHGKNFNDILKDELKKILFDTKIGVEIRKNMNKRELIKRGIFVADSDGVMCGFLEKGGGDKLSLEERYANIVALAYTLGEGKVLENLWFILEDSKTSLDIIKRFATTKTSPASQENVIGRVPDLSTFQEIFQGFLDIEENKKEKKRIRPWAQQVEEALASGKIYGISYGEGAAAADIANIENYFNMWERYVREYKGEKEIDLDIADGVKIAYRGDKDKLKYLLRNVKIIGKGTLEIGDGVLIQGGTIYVDGKLVIPDRTKIIDSQIIGPLEIRGEGAMILAASFEPRKYVYYDNGKRIDKLIVYGDEVTTTQTYSDKTSHVLRFVTSFDYKGKIYQMVGGKDRWAAIREEFKLYDRNYEDFEKVVRMKLEDVIKNADQWKELVEFIFTPTMSNEELMRANTAIVEMSDKYANGEVNIQELMEGIEDTLKSLISARFTATDSELFGNDVDEIFNLATTSPDGWSERRLDELILRAYENRSLPQIRKALEALTYQKLKDEPYGKALYGVLAAMHPLIIDSVEHGPLSWDNIAQSGREKSFHDLPLYGGGRGHKAAKEGTDSFAMAWILNTRGPAKNHVGIDSSNSVGAISMTGEGISAEDHRGKRGKRTLETRWKHKLEGRGDSAYRFELALRKEISTVEEDASLNSVTEQLIRRNKAFAVIKNGIIILAGPKEKQKAGMVDVTIPVTTDKSFKMQRLQEELRKNVPGKSFIVINGYNDALRKKKLGHLSHIVMTYGVTRKAIYMDGGYFDHLFSLPDGVDRIVEGAIHEGVHIDNEEANFENPVRNPLLSEEEIEEMAPSARVREAIQNRKVYSKTKRERPPQPSETDAGFSGTKLDKSEIPDRGLSEIEEAFAKAGLEKRITQELLKAHVNGNGIPDKVKDGITTETIGLGTTLYNIAASETPRKIILLGRDTDLDPDANEAAQACSKAVEKYLGDSFIEVRSNGRSLLDAMRDRIAQLNADGKIEGRDFVVLTIAGDATLDLINENERKDLGKILSILNPDGRMLPIIGLYDLIVRLAYNPGDTDSIWMCLNRIALKEDGQSFTKDDIQKLLSGGLFRMLPRIEKISVAEKVGAYTAAKKVIDTAL